MLYNTFSKRVEKRQTDFKLPTSGIGKKTSLSKLVMDARKFLEKRAAMSNLSTSEGIRLLHCVEQAAKKAEKDYKKNGVHVNTISPGHEGACIFLTTEYGLSPRQIENLISGYYPKEMCSLLLSIEYEREKRHTNGIDTHPVDKKHHRAPHLFLE